MLPTLVRRLESQIRRITPVELRELQALYPPKKVWPPDLSKLGFQEQLKYEKKYKRRVVLATARPRFDKIVKLTQLFSVTFVVSYMVLFMDWDQVNHPFDPLRAKLWAVFGAEYVPHKLRKGAQESKGIFTTDRSSARTSGG